MAATKPNPRAMTRQDVRDLDRWAIEVVGVPSIVLMENAGRNAADAIAAFLAGVAPTGRPTSIAVVAGTGNNGGDGFVIARHLLMRGHAVETFIIGPREKLTPDSVVNLAILEKLQAKTRFLLSPELEQLAGRLRPFDLVIDAIGGTGITGPLRGEPAQAVRQINAAARPVVAVDIPTGLDCDTGAAYDPCIEADLTVTMVAPKAGFAAPGADRYTGQVVVVDIGVPVS
jgi:NAD(P)H-hydrate epimerase